MFTNIGESGTILPQQLNAQAAIAMNNAILNTVKILTNEVKQLNDLVTTLGTATTALKSQNNDLKQGQTRLEQQIQRMGRTQREPAMNTTASPATNANTQPINPQRTQTNPVPTSTTNQCQHKPHSTTAEGLRNLGQCCKEGTRGQRKDHWTSQENQANHCGTQEQ